MISLQRLYEDIQPEFMYTTTSHHDVWHDYARDITCIFEYASKSQKNLSRFVCHVQLTMPDDEEYIALQTKAVYRILEQIFSDSHAVVTRITNMLDDDTQQDTIQWTHERKTITVQAKSGGISVCVDYPLSKFLRFLPIGG